MSFFGDIGGALGSIVGIGSPSSGASGLNYQPTQAPLLNPTNIGQTDTAYGQANSGIQNQQAFLNALAAQNGIGNQQAVFNQLQGVANGTGPNPAQAMLNQATAQNIGNQASLMASQRGASANPGLIAREAAMQGGALQQQSAGQGATLQAQQQLGALGQLGSIAGQQVGQQANALQGYNSAAQSEQQNLLNSIYQQNQASVGAQNNLNTVSGGLANTAAQGQQNFLGGALNGAGKILGSFASGGMVHRYADGGSTDNSSMSSTTQAADPQTSSLFGAIKSTVGKILYNSAPSNQSANQPNNDLMQQGSNPQQAANKSLNQAGNSFGGGLTKLFGGASTAGAGAGAGSGAGVGTAAGSGVGAGIASDAIPLLAAAKGGRVINGEMLAAQGKMVPGKAKVKGDSLKNDNVPALLSPGEVVIPRHIMESNDPANKAAQFVSAVLAKHRMGRKG